MKKSMVLAFLVLLCGLGYQQAWAKNWIIINSDTGNKGITVVVTTYEKNLNQEITTILYPGDAWSFNQEPIDVSVYGQPDDPIFPNRLWYSTERDIRFLASGVYSAFSNLSFRGGVIAVHLEQITPPLPTSLLLFNITNRIIKYHIGFVSGFIVPCDSVDGVLRNAQITRLLTGPNICFTDNIYAAVDMGNGKEVFTNKYQGRTQRGFFIFRESPTKEGTFEVTGPWANEF